MGAWEYWPARVPLRWRPGLAPCFVGWCIWGRDEREVEKRFKIKVLLKQCHKNPHSDLEVGLLGCNLIFYSPALVSFGTEFLETFYRAVYCFLPKCCGRCIKHLEFTQWFWHPCKASAPFHEGCGWLPSHGSVPLSNAVFLQGVSCLV